MSRPTGVYLDDDLAKLLKIVATMNESTISAVVRDALIQYLAAERSAHLHESVRGLFERLPPAGQPPKASVNSTKAKLQRAAV